MAQPDNFGFGEEAALLKESARKFFADNFPADRLHALVAELRTIPTLLQALIPIAVLITLLVLNVVHFGDHTLDGANQFALILASAVAGIIAVSLKVKWVDVRKSIVKSISSAMPSILILLMIGALASGVAHEINNPLGVINCYANLITKSAKDQPAIINDVEIIQKHTQSCKSIVQDLLNFARVSDTHKAKGDIRQALDGVLNILEKQTGGKRIAVHRQYANDLPDLEVDLDKMRQVFMNLIINAIQAIREDGQITVSAALTADGDQMEVRIADTGPGIPPDHIDSIFDPFFTTKTTGAGTGLGLSIS